MSTCVTVMLKNHTINAMEHWCFSNVGNNNWWYGIIGSGGYFKSTHLVFWFMDEKDATAFKIKYG